MPRQIKTITDIARELGISPSTVSRVLNKRGYYSPAVAERVEQLVAESGFVYNQSARSLRNAKSNLVGFMAPDISNQFTGTLVLHVETLLEEAGYSLLICNTAGDPERERRQLANLAASRVDGIICISSLTQVPVNYEKRNIPIVNLVYPNEGTLPAVTITNNERNLGQEVGKLLVARGCKNIYVLGRLLGEYLSGELPIGRLDGFSTALEQGGIELSVDHYLEIEHSGPRSVDETERVVHDLVATIGAPDAIFAMTDRYGVGVLNGLSSAGVEVPRQTMVVGYDDTPLAVTTRPRLTSVNRNPTQMAKIGCERLLEMIDHGIPAEPETVYVPGRIVERESTLR